MNDQTTDRDMNAVMRDWELPVNVEPRWLNAFVAMRFADILAQVAIGDRLHQLPAKDRAYLKAHAEALVTDVIGHYEGWQ